MKISTKRAEISDMPWLLEECIEFSKDYGSKYSLTGNLPHAVIFLESLIKNHFVLISFDGEVKTGFIAGMVQPHHFNPDILMLSEILWWVRKEHRGGSSGSKLLDDFILFGKEHCKWITFTIEKGTQIGDGPLLSRGFEMTEKAYLLEIN